MRHNVMGCGVGQVGNRAHYSMRRAHTHHDQVYSVGSGEL
jgi:hypothetical protein